MALGGTGGGGPVDDEEICLASLEQIGLTAWPDGNQAAPEVSLS